MKLRKLLVLLLLLGAAFILSACGKDGVQGETGDQGPKGETGAQGAKGATGKDGDPGVKGEQGANGVGIQFSYGSEGILWRYKGATEWNTGVRFEDLFKYLQTDTVKFDYYVDQSLTLSAGDPLIAHGNNLEYGKNAFSSVGSALTAIKAASAESGYKGAVLYLEAGVYDDAIAVDFDGLTIKGANTGLTLAHDSTFDVDSKDNTVLNGKLTVTANDFTLRGVVTKNQIVATAVEGLTLKEVVITANRSNGIVEFNGANKDVVADKVYVTGPTGNRIFYVYGSIENFKVTRNVVMDNASGLYDWVRISSSTEARVYGTVEISWNYIAKTLQSGYMDRVPAASKYIIKYNTMKNVPAAIYFRSATISTEMEIEVIGNTFENCGTCADDWDVVVVTTSATTKAKVNNNNFYDCPIGQGSKYHDYAIKIRTDAGEIDCANNFFNNETMKSENLNATGLTFLDAAFEAPEMPEDRFDNSKNEALFDALIVEFIADFKTASGKDLGTIDKLDTQYMDSVQMTTFLSDATSVAKWKWLLSALAELSGDNSHDPAREGFDAEANRGFFIANINAFFTMGQHKDNGLGVESMDFSDVAVVESILDQYAE